MHLQLEMTRRRSLAAGVIGMLSISATFAKDAFVKGPIPNFTAASPLWLAVPNFQTKDDQDRQLAIDTARLVGGVLARSGPYVLVDAKYVDDQTPTVDAIPRFSAWRSFGVDILVVGQVAELRDGRLQVDVRVWAVAARRELMAGQRFRAQASGSVLGLRLLQASMSVCTMVKLMAGRLGARSSATWPRADDAPPRA